MTVVNRSSLLIEAPIKNMLAKKVTEHGVSHGLTEAGYDIRIKQEIRFRKATQGFENQAKMWVEQKDAEGFLIDMRPARFTLASAIEEFEMPDYMMGIVHDKSTWARRGLSVFNTVIESGWKGFLTLELVYHGDEDLIIPAGSGIAQVIFHRLEQHARYNGKYQNQADRPVAAIYQD